MDGYSSRNKGKGSGDSGIQEVSAYVFTTPSPKPLGSMNKIENMAMAKENQKRLQETEDLVDELKKEISDLTGRLYEARSSRDAALRKNVEMQDSHLDQLKQMQQVIEKLERSNKALVKERDVDTFSQIENLERELEKMKSERTDLITRLQSTQKDLSRKGSEIDELKMKLKKLENYVNHLEYEKQDLVDNVKDYQSQTMEFEASKGALEVLQHQLDKCHRSWEQAKDELSDQKVKNRELEKALSSVEQELTTFKVDVRLLTREKKELEEKLSKETAHATSSRDQISEAVQSRRAAEKKNTELEKQASDLHQEIKHLQSSCERKTKMIEEQSEQIKTLQEEIKKLKKELVDSKASVVDMEKLRGDCSKYENLLKEKESIIEDKEKSIDKLQTGTKRLKEACMLLENQLREFETVMERNQNDLDRAVAQKEAAEKSCIAVEEELKKVKISLNEAVSLKVYAERKLADVEGTMKTGELEKVNEIHNLNTKIVDLKRSNDLLTEKMSDLLDRRDELQDAHDTFQQQCEQLTSENKLLKEESTKTLTEVMNLKESNMELKSALSEAISKCEAYKDKLESVSEDLALLEVGQAEKDLRWKSTLNQQIKLIEHLRDQNELLSTKKKKHFGGKLFSRDHKENKEQPTTPLSHLTKPIFSATPQRLIQEHKVVKTLEEEAANLKTQLAKLQVQKECPSEVHVDAVLPPKDVGVSKKCIFKEEGFDRLEINCIQHVDANVYLFGCEQGMFSRKVGDDKATNYAVTIEGPESVYQIEFMPSINLTLFIEGKDRRLAWTHLNLTKACAEAAACSKPKIKFQHIPDLKNCISFCTQESSDGAAFVVVALQKYLNVLVWEKDSLVLRHSLKTPEAVTCMLTTPNSVIFGCNKIFELDVKNFTMEEFMDESDDSMMYAMLACRESVHFPVAILDVTDSNVEYEGEHGITEYLLCFPDLAIFVDAYGRRSRSEDIMWSKLPLGVYYRHPDLFVVHFNSVEIIPLRPNSFTKSRISASDSSIGVEKIELPESKFVTMSNARFLGNGSKESSLVVATQSKSVFEAYELEACSTYT